MHDLIGLIVGAAMMFVIFWLYGKFFDITYSALKSVIKGIAERLK